MRLRIFVTSRSTPDVIDAFKDVQHQYLNLHKEHRDETATDLVTFLKQRFADIRQKWGITDPWPEPKQLSRLVTLSTTPSPLFIYAATLCRFVSDQARRKDPVKQLRIWLQQCDSNAPQLDQIYRPILHYALFGTYDKSRTSEPLDEEERKELFDILGTVVLGAIPLSCQAISSLLSVPEYRVNLRLRDFHAVLSVPHTHDRSVQLLHKSFSDFPLSQEGSGSNDYRLNAEETHALLATKCIQRMQKGLKQDICDIQKPGTSRDDISQEDIHGHIPADLRYACLHWVYHLKRSGRGMHDDVIAFLHKHFLYWLEALSLLGRLSDGALALMKLRKMIEVSRVSI